MRERKGKELTPEKLYEILLGIYPESLAEELLVRLAGKQAAKRIKEISKEIPEER